MALWTDTTPPKNDDSKLAPLLGASDDPLSYAKYGAWQIGFRNYLIRRGLAVYASLDLDTMIRSYPTDPKRAADSEQQLAYLEKCEELEHRYGIANKYVLARKSDQAYGLLAEACRDNVGLRREIAPHKDQFVQAFEALSIAIIGGVKEAAASLRKEIFDRIRSANTPKAIRCVISLAETNNDDLKQIDEGSQTITDEDLYNALRTQLKDVSSLVHVYHATAMPDSKLGEWEELVKFLKTIIPLDTTDTFDKPPSRPQRETALTAFAGGGRGGGGRGGQSARGGRGRGSGRGGAVIICWRCGGNHYSTASARFGTPACDVQCHCSICGADTHATEHHDQHEAAMARRNARANRDSAVAYSATATTHEDTQHLFCLVAVSSTDSKDDWTTQQPITIGLDSMASDHLMGSLELFDPLTLVEIDRAHAPIIEIANGVTSQPTHKGVVPLQVYGSNTHEGNDIIIRLRTVYYMPEWPDHHNLISVGRLENDKHDNFVVDSMNKSINIIDAQSDSVVYSFQFEKTPGCLWQLPCKPHVALDQATVLSGFAPPERACAMVAHSVGAPSAGLGALDHTTSSCDLLSLQPPTRYPANHDFYPSEDAILFFYAYKPDGEPNGANRFFGQQDKRLMWDDVAFGKFKFTSRGAPVPRNTTGIAKLRQRLQKLRVRLVNEGSTFIESMKIALDPLGVLAPPDDERTAGPSTFDSVGVTFPKKLTLTYLRKVNPKVRVEANCKKPGTLSGARYAKYQHARCLSEYFELGATRRDFLYDFNAGILKVIPDDGDGNDNNEIATKTEDQTATLKSVESEAIETAEILMDMNSIGTHGAVSVSDDEDDDTAFVNSLDDEWIGDYQEPTQEQIDRIAELFLDTSDEENLPVSRLMPKPKKKKMN